jgi:hypothetical protein
MAHRDNLKILYRKKGFSCSCYPCLIYFEVGLAGREPCEAFPEDETSGTWEADII